MIASSEAWGPFRSDLDPAERIARLRCLRAVVHLSTCHTRWGWRWRAAAKALPVRLNTHACRACIGRLSNSGSFPQRHSYGSRHGIDGECAILSVVVWAVFARTQSCVEIIWKYIIHSCLKHDCSGMIIFFEISTLSRSFAHIIARLFLFCHSCVFSLISVSKKKRGNLGDQPTEDVHWGILTGWRRTRPFRGNASRRSSAAELSETEFAACPEAC